MKYRKQLTSLLLFVLVFSVMLMASGCNMIMDIINSPIKVDYSSEAKERIERDIGIEPPSDENFVVGYMISDREQTTAYIFEFPYTGRTDDAAQYLIDLLGLSATHASELSEYDKNSSAFIVELGYEFTHYFSGKGYFSRVLYCINGDTLQVALVCKG